MNDPRSEEAMAAIQKGIGGIDVQTGFLRGKATTSRDWDQVEAKMLMDESLVDDSRCATFGDGEDKFIVFLRRGERELDSIQRRYGEPNERYTSGTGVEYVFYGRMMFMKRPGQPNIFMFRWVLR